jgi:hypothetical protein
VRRENIERERERREAQAHERVNSHRAKATTKEPRKKKTT